VLDLARALSVHGAVSAFRIRRATQHDAETVCRFVAAAAEEEKAPNAFTVDVYRRDAVGPQARIETWLVDDARGKVCAQAIVARGYDLARASPTMVLLHLYVAPERRRDGVARELISAVAVRAKEGGVKELTITTGVENAVARCFFAAIGAREDRLARYLLSADGIEWLAAEAG
jgi:GNAT superfamily N-acetyltransferase